MELQVVPQTKWKNFGGCALGNHLKLFFTYSLMLPALIFRVRFSNTCQQLELWNPPENTVNMKKMSIQQDKNAMIDSNECFSDDESNKNLALF